jgi:glycosyltransferase involved in cell wall biosynthesis
LRIILVASTSWNLFNFRLSLAKAIQAKGHEVILISPHDEYSQYLLNEGFKWVDIPLRPRSKNIILELQTIVHLTILYWKYQPDIVSHFTPKGVIYGSIAAKLSGKKRIINSITGLGYVFSGNANKILVKLVEFLYWISLQKSFVLFQNPDNMVFFTSQGISPKDRSFIIPGSGVDMTKFVYSPEPVGNNKIVMMATRFVAEKGIRYFVEAAKIMKSNNIPVKFVLVGKPELDQPTAIQLGEITEWVRDGLVEWWGWYTQMEQIYPKSNIICLPSYYMEGIPKSLIEGASCGRALVASNIPGCREIVHDCVNGYLIPAKNTKALVDAITQLALNDDLRKSMGEKSREIALSSYSELNIIHKYLEYYGID